MEDKAIHIWSNSSTVNRKRICTSKVSLARVIAKSILGDHNEGNTIRKMSVMIDADTSTLRNILQTVNGVIVFGLELKETVEQPFTRVKRFTNYLEEIHSFKCDSHFLMISSSLA